jgi:hypothetical protein
MSVTESTIHEYFRRYGWQYDYDDETQTWVTGFRGETSSFQVLVHLTDNWLYFIISPFVDGPRGATCLQRLHQYLLRLNHTVNMAKFSVDRDGDVVLTVELPTENLSYSQFCDGLNALSYYADEYYVDALNLAQDPTYVPAQDLDEDWLPMNLATDEFDKPN